MALGICDALSKNICALMLTIIIAWTPRIINLKSQIARFLAASLAESILKSALI